MPSNKGVFQSSIRCVVAAIGIGASVLLAGCANYQEADAGYERARKRVMASDEALASYAEKKQDLSRAITRGNTVDMAATIVEINPMHRMPAGFSHININIPSPVSLDDIAMYLAGNLQGLEVSIDGRESLLAMKSATGGKGKGGGAESSVADNLNKLIHVGRFQGKTRELLDSIASQADVTWRIRRNHLTFSYVDSRTYDFAALSTSMKFDNNIMTGGMAGGMAGGAGGAAGATSGGSTGSSMLNVDVKSNVDPWKDIASDLAATLPPGSGATYSILPSAGKVMITGRPSVIRRVDSHIQSLRHDMTRTVYISVALYAIKRDDLDNYGLNLNALFNNNLTSKYFSLNYISPTLAVASTAASATASTAGANNKFSGSQAIYQALTSLDHTTQVRRADMLVQNNQILSMHTLKEQAYVQSVGAGTTMTGIGGAIAFPTITPGVTTYGFSLMVQPRIVDDNHVQVEYRIDMSVLDNMASFSEGQGYSVQQPITSIIAIPVNRLRIRSGQTMIVSGMKVADKTLLKLGLGDDANMLLGGGRNGENATSDLIVVVTPIILSPDDDDDQGMGADVANGMGQAE